MICKSCGKEIPDSAAFCRFCGAKTQPPASSAGDNPFPFGNGLGGQGNTGDKPASDKNTGSVSKGLLIGVIAAGALLLVLLAVAGTLLIMKAVNERNTGMGGNSSVYVPDDRDDRKSTAERTQDEHTEKEAEDISDTTRAAASAKADDGSAADDAGQENQGEQAAEESGSEAEDETQQAIVREVASFQAGTREAELQAEINVLNSGEYRANEISVYELNRTPAPRSTTATWDNSVFYTLEGYVTTPGYTNKNNCILERKSLINHDTGNEIAYDVYINPANERINKIVSIERRENGLEVMEYYYTNAGIPIFVFRYYPDNYVATHAQQEISGERFQFKDNYMLTWRNIQGRAITNYVASDNQAAFIRQNWNPNTITTYNRLSDDLKRQYDQMEAVMLNAAYNTYDAMMNYKGTTLISGYVYDRDSVGIEQAAVYLYSSDFRSVMYMASTDKDGMYQISVPSDQYSYNLEIVVPGCEPVEIYDILVEAGILEAYQDGVVCIEEGAPEAGVEIELGDALTYAADGNGMEPLKNAKINIRKGIRNKTGEIITTVYSDDRGIVELTLPAGMYTAEVIAEGYETMYYTIVCSPYADRNYYAFYASPTLAEGEYAIVLTWGASPRDLDSHLFTTANAETRHIWFGNMSDGYASYLDVDDTTSYGPETVTIRTFNRDFYYKYAVVDYTDCVSGNTGSYNMSLSNATVNVYSKGGNVASFHVPENVSGVIWEVFEIRRGTITPIQRYYNNVTDKSWWHSDK
ncbi:MAG: zinc-ribbon domain-containing protein [Lachnospiraceae bacterium]|nr:zinc-ribbon domain-containing protein [Lachnospiraceae bacterium]